MRRRPWAVLVLSACGAVFFAGGVSLAGAGSGLGASGPQQRIFSIGVDGADRVSLSGNVGSLSDEGAVLSPDASKISFLRGPDRWVMNADGSGQRRLFSAPDGTSLDAAAWSPDGTRIAIEVWPGCGYRSAPVNTCGPIDGSSTIVNLDGTVVGGAGLHPVWSPDGKRIASDWGGVCGDEACYVAVVSDGDDLGEPGHRRTRLDPRVRLPADVCLQHPLWSGGWIAASTTTCDPDYYFDSPSTLYVFRVSGANVRRVRALPGVEASRWSPDGSRLAFKHGSSLLLARGDGSHGRRFATHVPNSSIVGWSPNGRSLAFVVASRLFIARGDGTGARPIAQTSGSAVWSPDGQSLAFVDRTTGQISVATTSGAPPRTITDEPSGSQLHILGWARNSNRIFYTGSV
jgi:Tol biopolymer transport system component